MNFDQVRLGRRLAATATVIGIVSLVVHLVAGDLGVVTDARSSDGDFGLFSTGNFALHFALAAIGFGTVAWMALPSQPNNGAIWALAWSALAGGITVAGSALVLLFVPEGVNSLSELMALSPSQLPAGGQIGALLTGGFWAPAIFLVLGVGLLLFPDGRAPTRRWRWVLWLNLLVIAALTLALILANNPSSTDPLDTSGDQFGGVAGEIASQLFFPLVIGVALSIISLIVKFRRTAGVARQQIQWIGVGGLLFLIGTILADPSAVLWPLLIGETFLIGAFFVSITKYRLYDINIVLSRTVTYVSLAVVLAALYGTAIVSYIILFSRPEEQATGDLGFALPIGATLLVAITFEPLRRRLQRWADRLIYGQRAAPHEVLSRLTAQLADTASGSALDTLARLLAEGTAAELAFVWLRVGDRLRVGAVYPRDHEIARRHRALQGDVTTSELELSVPVRRGEELLGLLEITKSPSHSVTSADIDLLADIAANAGLLLHNMRLNAELEDRAHQLRDSRRRLIAAHDEVRHRLERDLHDGAQQQVVALKVKLGLARTIAEREGADDIAALLRGLAEDTDGAVDAMRAVARGIYPPLLEAEGLDTALRAWVRTASADVELAARVERRHPRPVEETIYFSVIHAIGAAVAAGAQRVGVDVAEGSAAIDIGVRHDAPYELEVTPLVDRVDAHDGLLLVEPQRVTVTVPVAEAVTA